MSTVRSGNRRTTAYVNGVETEVAKNPPFGRLATQFPPLTADDFTRDPGWLAAPAICPTNCARVATIAARTPILARFFKQPSISWSTLVMPDGATLEERQLLARCAPKASVHLCAEGLARSRRTCACQRRPSGHCQRYAHVLGDLARPSAHKVNTRVGFNLRVGSPGSRLQVSINYHCQQTPSNQ